ncbi:MAG: hypothetical protein KDA99_04635 [Planctomycetales bacterium]|nr:hypothetical protein [Planctomycetales bacterium]
MADWFSPAEMFLATVVLAILTAAIVIWQSPRARGTTLIAPVVWSLVSIIAIVLAEWMGWQGTDGGRLAALRFSAAVTTFCPPMAVLGARRPQHLAWQWIVISLWVVLALPAAEACLVRRQASLQLHDARGWFLWGLILVGAGNWLLTRYWLAALAFAGAQVLLLTEHLPGWRSAMGPTGTFLAVFLTAIGALAVAWQNCRPLMIRSRDDRLWLDFRNSFGIVWGVRLQQRINASSHRYDWPIVLEWSGFGVRNDRPNVSPTILSDEHSEQLELAFQTMLRRFVDESWIRRRADATVSTH